MIKGTKNKDSEEVELLDINCISLISLDEPESEQIGSFENWQSRVFSGGKSYLGRVTE